MNVRGVVYTRYETHEMRLDIDTDTERIYSTATHIHNSCERTGGRMGEGVVVLGWYTHTCGTRSGCRCRSMRRPSNTVVHCEPHETRFYRKTKSTRMARRRRGKRPSVRRCMRHEGMNNKNSIACRKYTEH